MPRPQTIRPEHILACAADLFEQGGFDGVTTHAVAQAAGISEGALFRYFKSKDELFAAALMIRAGAPGYFQELRALLVQSETATEPLQAGLERVSRAAMSFYLKGVRAIAVLAVRLGCLPAKPSPPAAAGEMQPGPAAAHKILAEYFRRLERRGEVVPGDERVRAAAFLNGLFGYAFGAAFLNGGQPAAAAPSEAWYPDAETFRRQFVADFIRGIAARQPETQA
jgi:AcrR family transcriptional regulator